MNLICQTEALKNIKLLAEHNQHGVLIVGDPGSGKTYVARQYANLLGIKDFYIINPTIADLKAMIDACLGTTNPVVLCIENLDHGVAQASFPLLKLIEDCPKHVYVVVTCCNLRSLPDTIPSRCAMITINHPVASDIEQYARSIDPVRYEFLRKDKIWTCVKTFADADIVLKFTPEQLKYYNNIPNIINTKDSVSNMSWKLQHYDDNSETPLPFVLRYLLELLRGYKQMVCIECLNDLAENRISKNAVVAKLVFELKYVE